MAVGCWSPRILRNGQETRTAWKREHQATWPPRDHGEERPVPLHHTCQPWDWNQFARTACSMACWASETAGVGGPGGVAGVRACSEKNRI